MTASTNNNNNNSNNNTEVITGPLRPYDILCGRSKGIFDNIGNRRFRLTVGLYFKEYLKEDHDGRRRLISSITQTLRHEAGARFLKPLDENRFVELTESEARKKIGSAFRELNRTSNSDRNSQKKKGKRVSELHRRNQTKEPKISLAPIVRSAPIPSKDIVDCSPSKGGSLMDEIFGVLDQEIARQQDGSSSEKADVASTEAKKENSEEPVAQPLFCSTESLFVSTASFSFTHDDTMIAYCAL